MDEKLGIAFSIRGQRVSRELAVKVDHSIRDDIGDLTPQDYSVFVSANVIFIEVFNSEAESSIREHLEDFVANFIE